MKNKNWLKLKFYPHLNKQMHCRRSILKYVTNPKNIIKHSFYPLIHYSLSNKKFSRNGNNISFSNEYKDRDIYYAAHIDAQIYSYYASELEKKYENELSKSEQLFDCISSYRRIPVEDSGRNKCNIDFANDAFSFLKNNTSDLKTVLTFDIKGLFDNLDHKILKKAWSNLIEGNNLPEDHYKIFKNITMFAYVNLEDILKELNIKKLRHVKEKDIRSFLDNAYDFRTNIRQKGYVKSNKKVRDKSGKYVPRHYGIAQGTPISAILSNIYMLSFDKMVSEHIGSIESAFYRRYSDDIMIICNDEDSRKVKELVYNLLENLKLQPNIKKSEEFLVERISDEKLSIMKVDNDDLKSGYKIQYLGFEFNGVDVLLRSKSLSNYYRKMKKGIRRRAVFAMMFHNKKNRTHNNEINDQIFKNSLLKQYSHFGSKVGIVKVPQEDGSIQEKMKWGNFYTYAKKASEIINNGKIKRQLRNHIKIIDNKIKFYEKKYHLPHSTES